jgi:hypothetical protein
VADILTYSRIMRNVAEQQTRIDGDLEKILTECPWDPDGWLALPLLDADTVGTNYICVYDQASGWVRCNADCTWTVPAGASQVQFQIWGAGATGGGGQCCGGSPFGQNGGYATVIIDAVPGCQYVLCAGCAYCCYSQPGNGPIHLGQASYVTGFGLCGVCASGGCSNLYCHMEAVHGYNYGCCRYKSPQSQDASGGCICASGMWWCGDNSCASCGIINYCYHCCIADYFGCATTDVGGSGTATDVKGLKGGYAEACWDTNIYGYYKSHPVISPAHTKQPGSDCCFQYCGTTCNGGCYCGMASQGCRCYPGAGHNAAHVFGGGCVYGDPGRGGMVRVSWC